MTATAELALSEVESRTQGGGGTQEIFYIGTWASGYGSCTTGKSVTITEANILTGYIKQSTGRTGGTVFFKNRGAAIVTLKVYEAVVTTPIVFVPTTVARNAWVDVTQEALTIPAKAGDVEGECYFTLNRRHGPIIITADAASGTCEVYGKITMNGTDSRVKI